MLEFYLTMVIYFAIISLIFIILHYQYQILSIMQKNYTFVTGKYTPSLPSSYELQSTPVTESVPSSYELQRLEREINFDKRISGLVEELKNDIAARHPQQAHGTTAEILHPLIENLPHDSVKTIYDLPSYEEVAE